MRTIRFLDGETLWPYPRQTPQNDGVFGSSRFLYGPGEEPTDWLVVLDAVPAGYEVPIERSRSLFIARQPAEIRRYHRQFLDQFGSIVTSDRETPHRNRVFTQPGLPWQAGMRSGEASSYHQAEDFAGLAAGMPKKSRLCSVICPEPGDTPGQQLRRDFLAKLRAAFGSKLDYFGPGDLPLGAHDEALSAYRYHVVLEAAVASDYWSAGLADAFLRGCFPIYAGAPNIGDYFAEASLAAIDMAEPRAAIARLAGLLNAEPDPRADAAVAEARQRVLWEHNIFALVDRLAGELEMGLALSGRLQRFEPEARIAARYGERQWQTLVPRAVRGGALGARGLIGTANAGRLAGALRQGARRLDAWSERLAPAPPPTVRERAEAAWASAMGERTMRLDYPLGARAVVVDAHGGDGQWASDIVARYGCRVLVFEPEATLAAALAARFAANPLIGVFAQGLGAADAGTQTIGAQTLFDREKLGAIALLKLSLGGEEYGLIEALAAAGLIARIEDLQVQFTDFGAEAPARLQAVQRLLRRTHVPTYQYPFVWENWRRRAS